jgi:hypothetical protein
VIYSVQKIGNHQAFDYLGFRAKNSGDNSGISAGVTANKTAITAELKYGRSRWTPRAHSPNPTDEPANLR